jgi:hypothetical protein
MLTNAIFLVPAIIGMRMIVRPATAYVQQMRVNDQADGRRQQPVLISRKDLFEDQEPPAQ